MSDEQVAPSGHLSVAPVVGGLRDVLRVLRPIVGAGAIDAAGRAEPLERFATRGDPPTVATCIALDESDAIDLLEDSAPFPAVGVDAFLDGVQRSRVVGYVEGSPIVFATVAAVIRERADRQLTTWRAPAVRHLVLAERETVGEHVWDALTASGVATYDLTDESGAAVHPLATRLRAIDRVNTERETLERRLAAEWCRDEVRWLWIDGGISGNLAIDAGATAFGVVKSHTTLYGEPLAIRRALALTLGQRSPLFLVTHRARRGVASWYLRVHDARDGDPLHGLVRVEVAPPDSLFGASDPSRDTVDPEAVRWLSSRADQLSRWILADRAPVALPDPRWDTLSYGVYACEQFLKALIGS